MKKDLKAFCLVLLLLVLVYPFSLYAQVGGLKSPMGGKVKKVGKSATIVCAAFSGPIFIRPYNMAPPGPYFIRTGTKKPKVGGYILGSYSPIPDLSTCTNPETGVPIPAFEIKPYGVSS